MGLLGVMRQPCRQPARAQQHPGACDGAPAREGTPSVWGAGLGRLGVGGQGIRDQVRRAVRFKYEGGGFVRVRS